MQVTHIDDVITDNIISSSARRRRKCWVEVQHNESIEELFDRMTSTTNTPPPVDMDTNSSGDEMTTAAECSEGEGEDRTVSIYAGHEVIRIEKCLHTCRH